MNEATRKLIENTKVLILDIETNSLDIDDATARVVGVRTNKSSKVHCIWEDDFDILRKAIKGADIVVTFNGTNFDVPVLMNPENRLFKYITTISGKHFDLQEIVVKREDVLQLGLGIMPSLDKVCDALHLRRKQQDFDYTVLQKSKSQMTDEEIAMVEEYLTQDINITWDLYEYLERMFNPLAEFLPDQDVKRKTYIKSSTPAVAYKVICNLTGIPTTYSQTDEDDDSTYKGGAVVGPYAESAEGMVRCVDYTSAYPHAYMQANLYTRCKFCTEECEYRYNGGTTPDGVELKLQGNYCTKNGMGKKERVIQKLFLMRLDAKMQIKMFKTIENPTQEEIDQNDYLERLQYALKIVINILYGISGNPRFLQTYNEDTAADCTKICRFNLHYMHDFLEKKGHKKLYGDTDSCYIHITQEGFTDEMLQEQLDELIGNLKSIMPFPQETFNIDIEDPIKFVQYFYKDDGTGLMVGKKKQYVLLLDDGTVKAKGLAVIKRDSAKIAQMIWNGKIKDYIRENYSAKVPPSMIEMWISDLVAEDMKNAAKMFKVKELDTYKGTRSIQAQISMALGPGEHWLVKNKRNVGIGKNTKYATMDEAKNFTIDDLDLSGVFSNLADLTASSLISLSDFGVK